MADVISLFSGAMGLDLGLERAGFEVKVAVESNQYAAATIRLNRPTVSVIEKDISNVKTAEILKAGGLEVGGDTIVSAGPSCQTFSTAGSRESFEDPRGVLFQEFLRIVREAQPRFFVMENVPGMLSAAKKHRPLNKRGSGYSQLTPEEELGSAFTLILSELQKTGYYIVFDVLNAADYGTPQTRKRVIFIGSRDGEAIKIPSPTHSQNRIRGKKQWVTLAKALKTVNESDPEFLKITPKAQKYLKEIPEGGNWKDLSKRKQKAAMGAAYDSWGGRVGFFRRLSWSKPSPSLTTNPVSKATMLCHPVELRPLSIKEYMAIQQFPKRWKLAGSITQKYRQIGNAVPVGLGHAIGRALEAAIQSEERIEQRGILCENADLIRKLRERPRTMLNPARMRKVKSIELTSKWVNKRPNHRENFLQYLILPGVEEESAAAEKGIV